MRITSTDVKGLSDEDNSNDDIDEEIDTVLDLPKD